MKDPTITNAEEWAREPKDEGLGSSEPLKPQVERRVAIAVEEFKL